MKVVIMAGGRGTRIAALCWSGSWDPCGSRV